MVDVFEDKSSWKPYRDLLNDRLYEHAAAKCLETLEAYKASNADYADQHKGSPFYVLGFLSFAAHDYPGSTTFFDAALSEDLKNYPAQPNTPALRFMRLDNSQPYVLASEIIKGLVADVTELLDAYNARTDAASLALNDLRKRFLIPTITSPDAHRRALVTTLISFVAEWKYRQRLLALLPEGSREPFFLHLFRGCVLFESLLKDNPHNPVTKPRATLGDGLKLLYQNPPSTSEDELDLALAALSPNSTVFDAVGVTGKMRNTVGHKISWPSVNLTSTSYDLAVHAIATSCFYTIAKLY